MNINIKKVGPSLMDEEGGKERGRERGEKKVSRVSDELGKSRRENGIDGRYWVVIGFFELSACWSFSWVCVDTLLMLILVLLGIIVNSSTTFTFTLNIDIGI